MKPHRPFHPNERFEGAFGSDRPQVRPLYPGEHIDAMLLRFKKAVEADATLSLVRRRSVFVSDSQLRRSKSNYARKRAA